MVDEKALVSALKGGTIAAAGLASLKNVAFAPHIGTVTQDTIAMMGVLTVKNALAMLKGTRPLTPVNPAVLKSSRYLKKIKPRK